MKVAPLTLKQARAFVETHHRHNKAPHGHRFSIGLLFGQSLVGVAVCGRPIARLADLPGVVEVTRLCINEAAPRNACSFLYRACWRVWSAMGGDKLITYTLASESGSSLRGAGFREVSRTSGDTWNRPNRVRDNQAVSAQPKIKWEISK